ncbi:head-tail connector protein [Cohaesibacter gelatinilyticus]|uniref:Phage gp6-like head-tail connector protein n=1 Tax=Cohaesibacter gelatinilyticus TaxID=372072 RepID=A0A285PKC5_9HYPH|nr:head-tail connector protein [Cohaesibacter gelatinilyticus]SNZ21717.1 phage conserved hypothetical protein, phiE125 gp8 family [Cohaesibacter gelatinilyticus]
MFKPQLVVAPVAGLVTMDEVKAQGYIEHTDSDDLITRLIGAATSFLDGYSGQLGRCLISQTWKVEAHDWCRKIRLPFPDVQLATVKYLDENGDTQSVSASYVEITKEHTGDIVHLLDSFSFPALKDNAIARVWVEFVAGYGDAASDVPQAIRHAALLLIAHWYENREATMVGISSQHTKLAFDSLVQPFRQVGL